MSDQGVYKALVSLAMRLRKHAHSYKKWALKFEAVGKHGEYLYWRKQSGKAWRHAKWNIQRARSYK